MAACGSKRIVAFLCAGAVLSGCAPVRFGSPYENPQAPTTRNRDDHGAPPPVVRRSKGVIKKGETSGRSGNDTYVCGDPTCETAVRVE